MVSDGSYERVQIQPSHWKNDRLFFYKYMSASTAKIVIKNRTLRWSTPKELNDPFDIQFHMALKYDAAVLRPKIAHELWRILRGEVVRNTNSKIPAFMVELGKTMNIDEDQFTIEISPAIEEGFASIAKMLPKTSAELEQHLSSSKILCLTTEPTNSAMWTHYANQHTGVVFRFRSIPAFDSPYGSAVPVQYLDEPPSFYSEDELLGLMTGQPSNYADVLDRLTLTKSTHWAYEKEWRIHSGDGRDASASHEDINFNKHELDAIIFGMKATDADKSELATLAKEYPNASILQARKEATSFNFAFDEVIT